MGLSVHESGLPGADLAHLTAEPKLVDAIVRFIEKGNPPPDK